MTREQVLAKIRKCLALGNSSEPHEAAAAMRQARALMDQHGIDADQVAASAMTHHFARAGSRPPPHLRLLELTISDALGVRGFWARWAGTIIFIGPDPAPEVAAHAWIVLTRALEQGRRRYVDTLTRCRTATKRRRGEAYALGWVRGVKQVVFFYGGISAETKRAIESYAEQTFGKSQSAKPKPKTITKRDMGAVVAGYRDGRQQTLHRPLDGNTAAPALTAETPDNG